MMKLRISDVSQSLMAHSPDTAFCVDLRNGTVLERDTISTEDRSLYKSLPLLEEAQSMGVCWDFIDEIEDPAVCRELHTILKHSHETHEFPEFTEALYYHGLEEEWETYKEERLQHILADWCEHHGIEYNY